MKVNRYLVVVTSDEFLTEKAENISFLFPITKYSVGFAKTYSFASIQNSESYAYINRIFDSSSLKELKEELKMLNSNIKGLCFTDLGVIEVVKDLGLSLQLFYMQNHNTTNALSIQYYLEYVDSVLISTDITKKEIFTILDQSPRKLILPYFMLVDAMYSRRMLLSNFQDAFSLPKKAEMSLYEPVSKKNFLAVETKEGTVLYDKKFIDYREIRHDNILYYLIQPLGLSKNDLYKIIDGEDFKDYSDTGFLDKKTYYRLKEEEK